MPTLRRFDNSLMVPPDASAVADPALLAMLRSWCQGGAFPKLTEPLRVASTLPRAGLDHAACELDGSHELARLGRWRGLMWRLQILWREWREWHVRAHSAQRPRDPWDCGWWRDGALAAAESFEPRRATLLMVREPDPAVAAALLSTLRARSLSYAKPVRVLLVSAATPYSDEEGCVSIRPSA